MFIRRFIVSIMVTGAFLGGYRLGQNPNSPDVFAMATKGYAFAAEAGKTLVKVLGVQDGPLSQASTQD